MLVKQLKRICLVAVIVLAEHQINKMLLLIHQRERIELMIPDDIVGDLERGVRRRGNQLFQTGVMNSDTFTLVSMRERGSRGW